MNTENRAARVENQQAIQTVNCASYGVRKAKSEPLLSTEIFLSTTD